MFLKNKRLLAGASQRWLPHPFLVLLNFFWGIVILGLLVAP